VILQFGVSIILIICTIVIYQQIAFVKSRDLGYKKDGLAYTSLTGNMRRDFSVIKNDLLQTGYVQNASLSNNQVLQLGSNTGDFSWPGKDPGKQVLITVESVNPDYISTVGMRLKSGRDFYSNIRSDTNNIIINESLEKIIGNKNIIGSVVTRDDGKQKFTVIGVIKDFVYNSMYAPPAPLILYSDTSNVYTLQVRFKQFADLKTAKAKAEAVVKIDNPGYPVELNFVDAQFDQLFNTESLIGKLAGVFALLAIVISCLGLFGLSAYTAERRTKEIGIRKVLGASTAGLAQLLSRDFIKLVLIACFFAFPLAWLLMRNWLHDYEYRISVNWVLLYTGAGLLSIAIALLTISFQAIRAAIANPVRSLRTD
jgi:putative ABC transport system permease protein